MQWPIIRDLTRPNHHTPFILPRRNKSSRSNLKTSHWKRSTPHKRPTAILFVNVWPIVMRINYDIKARGKTIRTLHRLVFYSESVTHTGRIIGLVWMHLNTGSWIPLWKPDYHRCKNSRVPLAQWIQGWLLCWLHLARIRWLTGAPCTRPQAEW